MKKKLELIFKVYTVITAITFPTIIFIGYYLELKEKANYLIHILLWIEPISYVVFIYFFSEKCTNIYSKTKSSVPTILKCETNFEKNIVNFINFQSEYNEYEINIFDDNKIKVFVKKNFYISDVLVIYQITKLKKHKDIDKINKKIFEFLFQKKIINKSFFKPIYYKFIIYTDSIDEEKEKIVTTSLRIDTNIIYLYTILCKKSGYAYVGTQLKKYKKKAYNKNYKTVEKYFLSSSN